MSVRRKKRRTLEPSTASTPKLHFRAAGEGDDEFALSLRLDGAPFRLAALGPVDEKSLRARFRKNYSRERSTIICLGAQDIGWMQLREKERCIQIEQIHLVAPWRDHGIGGALIKDIIARARASGRAVELSVMRGNPAIRLYHRLGFRLVGEDPEKLHMRRKTTAR